MNQAREKQHSAPTATTDQQNTKTPQREPAKPAYPKGQVKEREHWTRSERD